MMMTIRNTDCDNKMYQSILDVLNDKTCNKKLKKFIDSFRKNFLKDLNIKCSRAYIAYVVIESIVMNKKRWKKFKTDYIKQMKVSS